MDMNMRRSRKLEEIMSEPYHCTNCGWQGMHRERIWARATGDVEPVRGYICPQCYQQTTERITEGEPQNVPEPNRSGEEAKGL